MTRSELVERGQSGLLLATPAIVVLLSLPLLAFEKNSTEFVGGARTLCPFALAALASTIIGLAMAFLSLFARKLSVVAGCVAIWIVFQDALAPLSWTQLDGSGRLTWTWNAAGIQFVIAIAIAVVAWLIPARHRRMFLLVIIAPTMLTSLFTLAMLPSANGPNSGARQHNVVAPVKRPNVYHIVLDGFSGSAFSASASATGPATDFAGFVWFADARASFVATDLSMPNFLTGTVPDHRPVTPWVKQAKGRGIREAMVKRGYQLALYTPDRQRGWSSPLAQSVVTSEQLSGVQRIDLDRLTIAKIAVVRSMPAPLKIRTLDLVSRYMIPDYLYYREFSTELIDQFLIDESKRPATGQYVYVHLMLPHPPYNRDGRCRKSEATDYDQQSQCAIVQVRRVLNELKRLDRLKQALIIVHSDHGMNIDGLPENARARQPDGKLARTMDQYADDVGGAKGFVQRTDALLLVHQPRVELAPLRTSRAPALLSDIPVTVATETGGTPKRWPGMPLLAIPENASRSRPFFSITRLIGDNTIPTDAAYIYNTDTGWQFATSRGQRQCGHC